MRARASKDGLTVRVIAGTHAALLAFDLAEGRRENCLGFSIERTDVETGDRRWLPNSLRFKTDPDAQWVTTARAPLQKFRWGDYTTEPGRLYRYRVVARYGTPAEVLATGKDAERPGAFDLIGGGVTLEVRTEDNRRPDTQVFFNRGAAASQAYVRKFGDNDPEAIPEALTWLSRGLEEALVAFIARADGPGFALHGCVYEFEKKTPIQALVQAKARGVAVEIVYHARPLGNTREDNEKAIADNGVDFASPRAAKPDGAIMHNKYLVLLRKTDAGLEPAAVWTGGTNWTDGGVYGQLNVGHAVFDPQVALRYEAGFQLLKTDPDAATSRARNGQITPVPQPPQRVSLSHGITPLFSPQAGDDMLELYADICASAKVLMVSAPFSLHKRIRDVLVSPTNDAMRFLLADKAGSFGGEIDVINADPGNAAAVAVVFRNSKLNAFQERKLARDRGLADESFHHAGIHIHSKIILADPFGADPVLVTGSANFSSNSTNTNDSNVLVFRGDTAVADIYAADFMRMFEHYWFRSKEAAKTKEADAKGVALDQVFALADTDAWSARYFVAGSREERDRLSFLGLRA